MEPSDNIFTIREWVDKHNNEKISIENLYKEDKKTWLVTFLSSSGIKTDVGDFFETFKTFVSETKEIAFKYVIPQVIRDFLTYGSDDNKDVCSNYILFLLDEYYKLFDENDPLSKFVFSDFELMISKNKPCYDSFPNIYENIRDVIRNKLCDTEINANEYHRKAYYIIAEEINFSGWCQEEEDEFDNKTYIYKLDRKWLKENFAAEFTCEMIDYCSQFSTIKPEDIMELHQEIIELGDQHSKFFDVLSHFIVIKENSVFLPIDHINEMLLVHHLIRFAERIKIDMSNEKCRDLNYICSLICDSRVEVCGEDVELTAISLEEDETFENPLKRFQDETFVNGNEPQLPRFFIFLNPFKKTPVEEFYFQQPSDKSSPVQKYVLVQKIQPSGALKDMKNEAYVCIYRNASL